MSTTKDLKKEALRYFDLYPKRDTIFATGDGNFFLSRNDAANHARTSKEKLYEFERDGKSSGENIDEEKLKMIEQLKQQALEIDIDKDDFRKMSTILKGLDRKAESQKKVDILAAFAVLQAELKQEAESKK